MLDCLPQALSGFWQCKILYQQNLLRCERCRGPDCPRQGSMPYSLSLGKCVPSTCKLPDADSHLLIAATMQALARTTIAPQRPQQHACRASVPSRLYSRSRASLMIQRAQPTVSAPFSAYHELNPMMCDRRIAEQQGVEALLMCASRV